LLRRFLGAAEGVFERVAQNGSDVVEVGGLEGKGRGVFLRQLERGAALLLDFGGAGGIAKVIERLADVRLRLRIARVDG
jgi:hypothetical protein